MTTEPGGRAAAIFGVLSADEDLVRDRIEAFREQHAGGAAHVMRSATRTCGVAAVTAGSRPAASTALAPDGTTMAAVAGDVWGRSDGSADPHAPASAQALLSLWARYGPGLIREASGMFAACIWDGAADRLHLLLDWVGGTHGLYYAQAGEAFLFADSPLPLLDDAWDGELDTTALAQYLDFGHILPPNTLFRGVMKLTPGCALTHGPGDSVRTARVFRHRFDPVRSDDWAERFRVVHRRSLERALSQQTGRPGVFVSGGIDSSYNAAVTRELTGGEMDTFSLVYADASVDESYYSRLMARHLGANHHELSLASADALDELPSMVFALQEPAMDSSFIPTFHLARFARESVDAVIGGDGPDHLLGRHYPLVTARAALRHLPGAGCLADSVLRQTHAGLRHAIWRRMRRREFGRFAWKALAAAHADPVQAYLSIYREIAYRSLIPARFRALLSAQACSELPDMASADPLIANAPAPESSDFDRLLALDTTIDGSFGVFAKVGHMAAYHGLTVREPFLDLELCELLHRVPEGLKAHGTRLQRLTNRAAKKHLLYIAAEGIVPAEVLHRPKAGFRAPIDAWLRERIDGLRAHQLLPALLSQVELLEPMAVDRLLHEHCNRICDHGTLLLMLVTLDLWYAIFVQNRGASPHWTWTDWLAQ